MKVFGDRVFSLPEHADARTGEIMRALWLPLVRTVDWSRANPDPSGQRPGLRETYGPHA